MTVTETHVDLAAPTTAGFEVHLEVFSGPFDVLLTLIARHRLDVTELALAAITDEFIDYIRSQGDDWKLDVASEFLVVAATLLDLKAARLLPRGEADDEDIALLEARDLLFARLLQYRAYKQVAAFLAERMADAGRSYPRTAGADPDHAALMPEVVLGVGPEMLAILAARASVPKPMPVVAIEHLHQVRVDMAEQRAILVADLRRGGQVSFRALVAGATSTAEVVARFLILLELYKEQLVVFDQVAPLADLTVRYAGEDQ